MTRLSEKAIRNKDPFSLFQKYANQAIGNEKDHYGVKIEDGLKVSVPLLVFVCVQLVCQAVFRHLREALWHDSLYL